MKKFDIITFGSVTQDIMFYTDEAVLVKNKKDILRKELIGFEYGAKIRSEDVSFSFGGGGSNTAVSFSKLGLKTGAVSRIGHDRFGDDYLKNFKAHNIDTTLIQRDEIKGSGFSFIVNHGNYNEHVIFSHRGANSNLIMESSKLKRRQAKWYYLAALSEKNLNKNLNAIFNLVTEKKIKIAWNPGVSELKRGYKFLKKYLKNTTLLNVNKDEAMEICASAGKKGLSLAKSREKSIRNLLKLLYDLGPEIVTISNGHLGAYVYDGKKVLFRKALPIVGINTTGAGDAYGSSLVAGIILFKGDLDKSLKLAIIRSNYVIQKIGAQVGLLDKKESLRLMNKL